MKRIFTLYFFVLLRLISQAQEELCERTYVHTNRIRYPADEEVRIRFYAADTHFQPSFFSKVGYVEISNTERPQTQLKLALDNGSGSGKIKIPANAPSDVYELSGHTQYTRNEREKIFFQRQVATTNTFRVTESNPITLADFAKAYPREVPAMSRNIRINTPRPSYSICQSVELIINGLPEGVSDLIASISRSDSLVILPRHEESAWRRQITSIPDAFPSQRIPKYEGRIIRGRIQTPEGETLKRIQDRYISTDITSVGKDIRYVQGQVNVEGNARFYASGIFGINDIVAVT